MNFEEIIRFLQRKKILPTTKCCIYCERKLVLRKKSKQKTDMFIDTTV